MKSTEQTQQSKPNKFLQFLDLFIIGGLIVSFSFWLNKYIIFDCIDSHIFSVQIIQGIFGTTLPKFGIFSQDVSIIIRIQHYPIFSCLVFYIMAYFISKIPVIYALTFHDLDVDSGKEHYKKFKKGSFGARAIAAHEDTMDILPLFTILILIGYIAFEVEELMAMRFCFVFLSSRLLYQIFYLINFSFLKRVFWWIAMSNIIYYMYRMMIVWKIEQVK
eukprot:gene6285-10292_t